MQCRQPIHRIQLDVPQYPQELRRNARQLRAGKGLQKLGSHRCESPGKGLLREISRIVKTESLLVSLLLQPQLRLIHNELSSSDFVNFHLRFEATVYNQSSSK
jgi:hypothetical protein